MKSRNARFGPGPFPTHAAYPAEFARTNGANDGRGHRIGLSENRYARSREELASDTTSMSFQTGYPDVHAFFQAQRLNTGMARTMNSSNNGTVKAMSPCAGLKIIPFLINFARTGPRLVTFTFKVSAMSPVR